MEAAAIIYRDKVLAALEALPVVLIRHQELFNANRAL